MNLRSVDLNLLVVLDALLDEAHVSRAAQRLNLSQPAVSNCLQRCRDLFDDPLLERGRGEMRRTPKAESLRAPLKSVLVGVRELIGPAEPDLRELRQVIRISSADDPTAILASGLIAALRDTAPGITVVFQPWHGADAALKELLDGDTDIAISVFDRDEEHIERVKLFDEDYVVVMRRDHPAAGEFCLDSWLSYPHVVVSGRGDMRTPVDAKLQSIGRSRRVGIVVPSFQLVPRILRASDFIAMMPRHGFQFHGGDDLVSMDAPLPVEGFPLHLAWHTRRTNDPGLCHVINLIAASFPQQ